jgi:parallel beta-helix repeat protein
MRKFIALFLFLPLPLILNAQLNGTGTYADPWNGTLAGDASWSGTKYINGDITVDNERLTINAGAVIVFLNDEADLIVTGTGSLNASGNSGSMITITSDDDNDGNYGESGERWGHIFFNAPNESNQSVIDYCIIEFGDVHNFADSRGYGGAIFSNLSNLIISNSILRNNYGDWGGAVFVYSSKNPTIRNCYIQNNRSDHGGGGIYCWNSSGPLIENCIFESNQCLEISTFYYTGGGVAAQTNCLIKLINCTFVNNSSTQTEGQSLLIHGSPNSLVINSIFWGSSDKQIYSYGTTANVYVNCAYRGINYSSGTPVNPIVLSADNSASDGPNFINPSSSNWNLYFISPCCNKGVNSYTGVSVPLNDYAGNPRIGIKDIGSYEVQYSYWNGSSNTSWNTSSNWDGNVDPSTGSGDVIVPSGLATYPTSPSNPAFTIGTGKQMILNPGAKVTLSSIINNGTLRLESDASNISSLIAGSFSGNNATIQLYLTGGGTKTTYKWHYISSPVTSLPVSVFTTVTPDIVCYYDSRVTTDLVQGWVAQDGWIYATGSFGGPTFTTLTLGRGYDFYDSANNMFTFNGQLNTADVPMTLDFAGGANNGFNLLGNPFPSGLDWDYIISQPDYPSNTSKGLYFTRDNTLCSYIAGVGTPSDVNGYIPPIQGFFTKTYATGKTINLAAAAKTHSAHARYKGTETIPLIRLSLADDTLTDETVIRFDEKASTSLDYDYDALKIFYSTENTAIYSVSEGSKYVINGQPFPDTTVAIPVGVNLLASGPHSISTTQLQGLDAYGVYLKDNFTGFTADLKTNPVVTFTASAGSLPDRFILKVTNYTTGIPETNISKALFNIYHGLGFVNILPLADDWDANPGSVTIFDMTGRKVHELRNVEFVKNSIISLQSPDSKGIYIVKIKSGTKRYTEKVVIK